MTPPSPVTETKENALPSETTIETSRIADALRAIAYLSYRPYAVSRADMVIRFDVDSDKALSRLLIDLDDRGFELDEETMILSRRLGVFATIEIDVHALATDDVYRLVNLYQSEW